MHTLRALIAPVIAAVTLGIAALLVTFPEHFELADEAPSETMLGLLAEELRAEEDVATRITPPDDPADQKGKMKFIAGMIAMTRPSIKDVGKVATDIVTVSAKRKVDPFYVAAIISVESRFHEQARSVAGATGLMQLLPSTARGIAREKGMKSLSLTDSHSNISLGVDYIHSLEKRYRGNRYLALAAYNWGPGNVDRVVRGRTHIPQSVRRYASTILERSINWSRHYRKATESASGFDRVIATQAPAKQAS